MHLLGFKLTVNPCEVFSEAMPCLRYLRDILCRWWAFLFSLYSFSEHVCSIIASMLRNLKSQQRSRLLSKFTENDCEKVCIIVVLLVSSFFFLPCNPFLFCISCFWVLHQTVLLSSLPVVFFSFRAGVLYFLNLNDLKIDFLKLLCTLCNRNALINIRSR